MTIAFQHDCAAWHIRAEKQRMPGCFAFSIVDKPAWKQGWTWLFQHDCAAWHIVMARDARLLCHSGISCMADQAGLAYLERYAGGLARKAI